eukprot:1147475-Pelagomonas_calceolata.AAC.2
MQNLLMQRSCDPCTHGPEWKQLAKKLTHMAGALAAELGVVGLPPGILSLVQAQTYCLIAAIQLSTLASVEKNDIGCNRPGQEVLDSQNLDWK